MHHGSRSVAGRLVQLARSAIAQAKAFIGRLAVAFLYDRRFKPRGVCRNLPAFGIRTIAIDFAGDSERYEVLSVPDGRLMSDGNQTVALIAADLLVPGPSFHRPRWIKPALPPEQNAMLAWGRVPGAPRQVKGVLLSLLSDLDGSNNYYHWMVDVLPRLHLAEKAGFPPSSFDAHLVPDNSLPFQIDSLRCVGLEPGVCMSAKQAPHVTADTIVATTHPCPLLMDVPAWVVDWLRDTFLRHASARRPGRRIFISRGDVGNRRLLNEDECYDSVLKPAGFERLRLSDMPLSEQVAVFAGAEAVIGSHGAGLVNLVFCANRTKVLELFGPWQIPVFAAIARVRGLHYNAIVSDDYEKDTPSRRSSFTVDPQEIKRAITLWTS